MRIKPAVSTLDRALFKAQANIGTARSSTFTASRGRTTSTSIRTMAWHSSGSTNEELINNLFKNGLITSERVRGAMLKVDRAHYCPNPSTAYADAPQPIGHAATISAPHMHASALEHLFPSLSSSSSSTTYPPLNRSMRVLDIGSGSGYLTHCMAELVGEGGRVVGVEYIPALAELGRGNMGKSERGRELLESGRVEFVVGDGRQGRSEGKPWDAIHVGASAERIFEALVEQLACPGRMFVPVDDEDGGGGQHVWVVDRDGEGRVSRRRLFAVGYVPLVDPGKRL